MKSHFAWTFGAAALAAALATGARAADVGVSIQFSQPGVYGRVDIGQYPQPQVILAAPLMIERGPRDAPPPPPEYLYVPPEHREHWKQHCREYHACDRPVYFVDHDWYKRNVIARDEERRRGRGRPDDDHERHRGHDEGGDEDHGHGHGHD